MLTKGGIKDFKIDEKKHMIWEHEKKMPLLIAVCATCVSLTFSFLFYWGADVSIGGVADPDGYGNLGLSIWRGYGFAVEPDKGPIIHRPPGYPLFIALVLSFSGGWYPGCIWVVQSLLLGLIAALAFACAKKLWGRSAGLLASIGCAFSPAFIWYAGRMWNEILLAFLFLSLFSILLNISAGWTTLKCLGAGIVLGVLCITKGMFLPFIVIVPAFLFMTTAEIGKSRMSLIPLMAILILVPWSIRNYMVSGAFVPVHTRMYFNLEVGNIYARNIMTSPISYGEIWNMYVTPMAERISESVPPGIEGEIEKEAIYKEMALKGIVSNPFFIVKKAFVSGIMFWGMGDTPAKTVINILVRIPVLILAIVGLFAALEMNSKAAWTGITLVAFYWTLHLPFGAPARVSTPVLPILFVFASAGILKLWFRFLQSK